MWKSIRRTLKRYWKNVALVLLACHFIVDITAYGNLGYTAYKFFV